MLRVYLREFYPVIVFHLMWMTALLPAFGSGIDKPKQPPVLETYGGGDYTVYGVSLYSSTVWSPFGPVTEPGFRIRAASFTGAHGNRGGSVFSGAFLPSSAKTASDVMAGYLANHGELWLKFYGGVSYQTTAGLIWEVNGGYVKESFSAKAALESWWKLEDRLWASADITWTDARNGISLYTKLGYDFARFDNGLVVSLGTEAGAGRSDLKGSGGSNPASEHLRGGGLLNVRHGHHDFTLSGGLSHNFSDSDVQPYAAISYGRKF